MAGFITAEGIVVPAGSDTYDYVNDQRRLAGSIRSIVPVADQVTGDIVAAAMATDGRPVTDSNPLITWQADTQAINIKGAAGWHPKYTVVAPLSPTSWTTTGNFYLLPFGDRTLVTATLTVARTGTSVSCPGGGVNFTLVGTIAPAAALSATSQNIGWYGYISGSGTYAEFDVVFNPNNGQLSLRGGAGATSVFGSGGQMSFQLTYIQ
jgi:hypothetical protein